MIEPGTLRLERLLSGPVERIWAYLTEPDKRAQWLAGGTMELRPVGNVELRFRHADLSPEIAEIPERFKSFEGGVNTPGRVTRVRPPRLLAITWDEGNGVKA